VIAVLAVAQGVRASPRVGIDRRGTIWRFEHGRRDVESEPTSATTIFGY
jgi:hypothetical protein